MNTLDIIIICTLSFLIVRGIIRGFIREITSLAGIIAAIWIANGFHPQVTQVLKRYVSPFPLMSLVSFGIIFTAVIIVSAIVGFFLRKIVKKILLGWADRIFGGGIAAIKGIVLTYLVIILLTFFLPSRTPLIAKSRLAPLIVSSYQAMVGLISPEFYEKWKKKLAPEEKKVPKKITRNTGHPGNDQKLG